MDNRYNRHNRRRYSLKVHIVLVTKYRKQLLKSTIADDVKHHLPREVGFRLDKRKDFNYEFF